mmetsp:Transcript_56018/g.99747  ORF Transcript_56018/g.99747 Transcript_56018/m.99747 type:complete len:221 (-) Transcript_56018:24-686(-)
MRKDIVAVLVHIAARHGVAMQGPVRVLLQHIVILVLFIVQGGEDPCVARKQFLFLALPVCLLEDGPAVLIAHEAQHLDKVMVQLLVLLIQDGDLELCRLPISPKVLRAHAAASSWPTGPLGGARSSTLGRGSTGLVGLCFGLGLRLLVALGAPRGRQLNDRFDVLHAVLVPIHFLHVEDAPPDVLQVDLHQAPRLPQLQALGGADELLALILLRRWRSPA